MIHISRFIGFIRTFLFGSLRRIDCFKGSFILWVLLYFAQSFKVHPFMFLPRYVLVFKTPLFTTNIEQHFADWSIFLSIVAFLSPILAILKSKLYYKIKYWKHHYFLALCRENYGVKVFMKLNIENGITVLEFWRRMLKPRPVNPRTYISQYLKIDPREGHW